MKLNTALFHLTIGLECHVQLLTKTKVFSPAPVTFHAPPNTAVHAIDLGYPGYLPQLNQKVVHLALWLAHIFNMKVADQIVFDRKNYYYSDLSKGFQITQAQTPVGIDGVFTFPFQNEDCQAHIKQIQIEEDTAKQTRTENGFLLDYNRAGVGLIEIVTTPCFHSADAVCAYLSYLQQTLVWCGISQADMSRGSLRCDVNLSLRKINSIEPGVVVEIKNLNSLRNIRTAINYEIKRQQTLLLQSQAIIKETRRFNEQTQQTQSARIKQTNALYRFIVEPNIHPTALTKSYVQKITAQCPTAPLTWVKYFREKYHWANTEITALMQHQQLFNFWQKYWDSLSTSEQSAVKSYLIKIIFLFNRYWNATQWKQISKNCWWKITDVTCLMRTLQDQKITFHTIRQLVSKLFSPQNHTTFQQLLKQHTTRDVTWNVVMIRQHIQTIIKENAEFLRTNRTRPRRINSFIMGRLMKISQGMVNPKIAIEYIRDALTTFFANN